jgi:hypothetical protein
MLHLTYYAWVALPSAEEAKTPAILLDSVLDRETLPAGWRARSRQIYVRLWLIKRVWDRIITDKTLDSWTTRWLSPSILMTSPT